MDALDIELAKQKRISELQDLHKAYRRLFLRRGAAKQVLAHLNKVCFMKAITYVPDESSPEIGMAVREGRRSVALHIQYMLEPENFTDETLTQKMTEEHYHAMD